MCAFGSLWQNDSCLYATDKHYKDGKNHVAQDTFGIFLAAGYISNTTDFFFKKKLVSVVVNNNTVWGKKSKLDGKHCWVTDKTYRSKAVQ